MIRAMRYAVVSMLAGAALLLAACGAGAGTGDASFADISPGAPAPEAAFAKRVAGAPEAPASAAIMVERTVEVEREVVISQSGALAADTLAIEERDLQSNVASQQRIIVRNVDMGLVVDDVASGVDVIGELAVELGGWVVSSDRSQKHRAFVSLRVPADMLDLAVARLRALSVEVESEVTNSRDVTDEYVDLTSRLTNLQATEEALLKLLERAEKVEDALNVQTELTRVRGEIERFQGRIKFLEETSAFSLINVHLKLAPVDMPVDAGVDQTFSVGQPGRFRASFVPPEDIEEFIFTWDFGDGSPLITSTRTAPAIEPGTRFTATVNHVYGDDRDSPYIVEVEINGTGDAGVAEGSDTIIATVTKVATIEVFAGESRIVDQGEEVEFLGSFTRPEGLTDLSFRWDFGDGTPPVSGSLGEDATRASVTHVYADHRPFAYTATLTISAQSEVGEVEATNTLSVLVRESPGWTIAGWSPGDTGKTAVRALSGVGQVLVNILIWLGLFSPVWVVIAVAAIYLRRRSRRGPTPPREPTPGAAPPAGPNPAE